MQHPIGEAKNVHALWDGGIVNALHESDLKLADQLEGTIGRLSGGQRRRWSNGNVNDWIWESHLLAKQDIYDRLHTPLEPVVFPSACTTAPAEIANFRPYISTAYINEMKPVVREQLAKAGLRLAHLLNQTLK